MPRARPSEHEFRQTAATQNGSGCFSAYSLPLFAVALITCFLIALSSNMPMYRSALPLQNPIETKGISPIFTREVQYWANDIIRWANASSLDPDLVAVVMQIESCGDPLATSSAGAMGLFQVMPFHFHVGENPYYPETNALRGLNYLSRSLKTAQGDVRLALAGYNGGIGIISRGERTWPAQTKRYVQYGAPIYEDAQAGASQSIHLQEWYVRYGAALCRQAARRLGLP